MDSRLQNHARSAASAGLAAAICMAIVQIIWLAMGEDVGRAILYGVSISSIAFGGTYAGMFFMSIRKGGAA
ncbi:hypothetical protein [Tomitella fengzijianii]|uniref:Uncharacterized protein n=1 Tax=Tomitella fengzijianii TaxID=2597660 RepID=A0A516X4U2_9ACTN|nr:hypothetical protein [Tomitella fengzijianii]QDQ98095.1 hypothetical protein FO059_13210 [Tomitella fengzijianii]